MLVKQIMAVVPAGTAWTSVLQLQPISLPMIAAGKGTNAIGLDEEVAAGRGPGIMTSLSVGFHTPELEALVRPLVLACQKDFDEHAAARDAKWSWRYLNYADLAFDALGSYGAKSVAQMQAVSARYDPDGVFQHLRKSGFKVPR